MRVKIPYWLAKKNGIEGLRRRGGIVASGQLVTETEKAYRLNIDGTEHWLPKSQVEVLEGEKEPVSFDGMWTDDFIDDFIAELESLRGKKVRVTIEEI